MVPKVSDLGAGRVGVDPLFTRPVVGVVVVVVGAGAGVEVGVGVGLGVGVVVVVGVGSGRAGDTGVVDVEGVAGLTGVGVGVFMVAVFVSFAAAPGGGHWFDGFTF